MSGPHYLDRLLDGASVEWRALGDVIKLEKGRQLNKELLSEHGLYPAYNGGISHSGFTDSFNYENKTIISQGGASAGFVNFVNSKFYANAHCYVVLPNTDIISNRYVYHVLKLNQDRLTEKQHGAGIPALRTSAILGIQTPIPCPDNSQKSLAIQSEIVRILDTFIELTTELTTELTIRKKQYQHYRDELLQFEDGEAEWKTLGDERLVEIADNARRPVKASLREPGATPYYGANNIQDYVEGHTHDGEYVLIAEDGSASLEEYSIQYVKGKFWANNHVHVVRGKIPLMTRFLYHYLRTVNFTPYLPNKGRAKLTKGDMLKIPVPIPCPSNSGESLAKQTRIVEILDKFDTLTSSLSEGLPREIALRQQQYAYYRDRLLSFPKPEGRAG